MNIEIVDKMIHKQLRKINGDNNKAKNKTQYVSALYTNLLPNVIKNELKKLCTNVSFKTMNNLKNILKLRACLLYTSRCV